MTNNSTEKKIYPESLDVIPYGRQSIDDEDIQAVMDVLKSKAITQGAKIQEFELALCKELGASFSVAVNSGTAALHAACFAAGIGPQDEVITSAITFVASANCAVYCGGQPVFVDIDPQTYNISPQEIEKNINKNTKAIIPVHFAGQSCDMEAIEAIVRAGEKKYGHKIYIMEDACHTLGSHYKEKKVGSCGYSDMTVLSFHPVKHITTGEGGAILTNDKELQRKLRCFRTHGITNNPDEFVYQDNAFEKKLGHEEALFKKQWYYEQNCLGHNYRITDIQCALGISQLKKLDDFLRRRREIVHQYNRSFKDVEWLTIPYERDPGSSNFHLYVLQFDFKEMGISRACAMSALKEKGILTQVHYIPVYTHPFYRENFKTNWGDCPVAERYYEKCLSIPLYPAMNDGDVKSVIKAVRELGKE
jgi:perosamine synthetase